ncbi:MAG TPA: class I tRNA ligase family protein [Planctomycetota bacterium]|jgi:methionyl-tRNA synthetase|nr:class I tRNA ligase family protein [Planctomycetota bacterium]
MAKFYITTAIDYVNSAPHVGTSYEKILADVVARWKRLKGEDVYFVMGNDEHSQQVADKAAEKGLTPIQWCDQMEEKFRTTWKKLDLSFDHFIRTSNPAHHRACQEIFRRLRAKGDIKKALYKGLYCIGCEARKTESELVNGKCPNHQGLVLKQLEEENYFFLLSKYAEPVKKLIQRGDFIDPAFRANEMLQVIEQGLEDISISRRTTKWGVPIPDDPEQVMYVWFDALINYITAAGFPDDMARFSKIWPADVHVIGKDITRFHAVIWPAMLLSAGIEPPKKLNIHGFVYIEGRKASKSDQAQVDDPTLAILKDPIKLADQFSADSVRYFLLREVAFGQDGDISWQKLLTRHTSELGNILGNLLNRTVSMTERYCGGEFASKGTPLPQEATLHESVDGLADRITPLMEKNEFHNVLAEIMKAVTSTNGFIEACAPWTLSKQGKKEEVARVLYDSAEALRIFAILLSSFMPTTSRRILEQLGIPDTPLQLENARTWEYIRLGTRVQKGPVLFQKIDANAEQP